MIVDNSNYAVKNKLLRMALIIVMFACVTAVIMLPELDTMLGLSRHYLSAALVLFFTGFFTYRYFREYCFVYFSTDLGKITMRYYHLVTVFKKFKAFEFPIAEYHKYEIIKKGLKHHLVMYRKEGNKITRYPSVSISSLKKQELTRIIEALDSIQSRKK